MPIERSFLSMLGVIVKCNIYFCGLFLFSCGGFYCSIIFFGGQGGQGKDTGVFGYSLQFGILHICA